MYRLCNIGLGYSYTACRLRHHDKFSGKKRTRLLIISDDELSAAEQNTVHLYQTRLCVDRPIRQDSFVKVEGTLTKLATACRYKQVLDLGLNSQGDSCPFCLDLDLIEIVWALSLTRSSAVARITDRTAYDKRYSYRPLFGKAVAFKSIHLQFQTDTCEHTKTA